MPKSPIAKGIACAALVAALVVTWTACGSATIVTGVEIASIEIQPPTFSLSVGDTVRLTAVARDADGNEVASATITWAVSDAAIATVDSDGLVTAVAQGAVNVEASTSGVMASSSGTVSSVARTVFFTEGFEDSNGSSRGWFDNSNFTLSTAEKRNGASSLEWHFQAGAIYPDFGGTARIQFQESESVYMGYWVKYSDNWTGSGQPYHPHEFYFLTNADDRWIGPAETSLTFYVEHRYINGLEPTLGMQDALNVDQSQIGVDLSAVTENRGVAGCNGNTDGYPTDCYDAGGGFHRNGKAFRGAAYLNDTPGPQYKGDWHYIEVYLQLNSIVNNVGQTDGVVQYWIDGQILMDLDDVLFRTGEHPSMRFHELLLGPYIGPGAPQAQTTWIDDITVADRR